MCFRILPDNRSIRQMELCGDERDKSSFEGERGVKSDIDTVLVFLRMGIGMLYRRSNIRIWP